MMLSFCSGPAIKVYKHSVLNLICRLLKSVYQGKKKKIQQTKLPVLPQIRHVHPTTRASFLAPYTMLCILIPTQSPQAHSPAPWWGCGGNIQTFKQKKCAKLHEFLRFPTTSSVRCHHSRAATSFPQNISPWLYSISSSALCSP